MGSIVSADQFFLYWVVVAPLAMNLFFFGGGGGRGGGGGTPEGM